MSLINDALKRARQDRQQKPSNGRSALPLQPVEGAARPGRLVRIAIALLMWAALTLSGWCFWQWWRIRGESERTAGVADGPMAFAAAKSETPAPPMHPIKVSTDIVVRANFVAPSQPETETLPAPTVTAIPAPPANAPATEATNVVASPPTNALAAARPPAPFADLKLQSIVFREDKPAAVVNGEMLFVGDEIGGARVLKIERQSVTVEREGETHELRLPRL